MHEKSLPSGSRDLLSALKESASPALGGWTLAGGTGLALLVGHRRSEDFDFFRTEGMDAEGLHRVFSGLGEYETMQQSERTLSILVRGVKMSFFQVKDPFLFSPQRFLFFEVADARDIAVMKLLAITNRGSRKDFVDLYTILRDGPDLKYYLDLMPRKYGTSRINAYQVLMSLTWFDDAEEEPPPMMIEPFDWDECKAFFVRETRRIVLPPA